jgi:hypothetical protein
VNEVPYRLVIDFETPLGKFGDEPAQGEVFFLDPEKQPGAVLARNCLRPVPAHLAGQNAARFAQAANPIDHRADPYGKMRCRLAPRQATLFNRRNNPFSKISRIWSSHPCWPPPQPAG